MKFIDMGEARFCKERMSEFLMVSKNLEIKELSNGIEMNNHIASKEESIGHENSFAEGDIDKDPTQNMNEAVKPETNTANKPIPVNNKTNKEQSRWYTKYTCNLCDHQATKKNSLTKHIQSKHGGVRYECNQCGKQYTELGSLTKHIQSAHEGVKYACNQCNYQATTQGHMTRHTQSIHEGVKYECNKCQKKFTTQSNLTTHIQSVHEGVKHACNQCGKQYTEKGTLGKHIKSAHEGV